MQPKISYSRTPENPLQIHSKIFKSLREVITIHSSTFCHAKAISTPYASSTYVGVELWPNFPFLDPDVACRGMATTQEELDLLQEHPLSAQESARRPRQRASSRQPLSSYFDLKSQSDARAAEVYPSQHNIDGNATPRSGDSRPLLASLGVLWKHGSPVLSKSTRPPALANPSDILAEPWYQYDDDKIDSLLSSPSEFRRTIRLLAQSLGEMNTRYEDLQNLRQRDAGKEDRARKRVTLIMRDLRPSEREVARRVLEAVFDDLDDDGPSLFHAESDHVRTLSSMRPPGSLFIRGPVSPRIPFRGDGRYICTARADPCNLYSFGQ
jgi:hypothetical protein